MGSIKHPPGSDAVGIEAGFLAASVEALDAERARDPKFYTARTKRAVNSLTVERGPKAVPHE